MRFDPSRVDSICRLIRGFAPRNWPKMNAGPRGGVCCLEERSTMNSSVDQATTVAPVTLRKSDERGLVDYGWLTSRHTFSFGEYYDTRHMGFRALRVINEDRVAPGRGFDSHPHRDMEILSYVIEGGLQHKDSMENGSVIRPGDVQLMSAGTGVRHSEFNASKRDPAHFLQIWIEPDHRGLTPSYHQIHLEDREKQGALRLIGSRDGRDGSVTIHQDVNVYAGRLLEKEEIQLAVDPGRNLWVQLIAGRVAVQDTVLDVGDGASLTGLTSIPFKGLESAELLVFDLA